MNLKVSSLATNLCLQSSLLLKLTKLCKNYFFECKRSPKKNTLKCFVLRGHSFESQLWHNDECVCSQDQSAMRLTKVRLDPNKNSSLAEIFEL